MHGVARAGLATSLPQPIGLAATFNNAAIYKTGVIISDEARVPKLNVSIVALSIDEQKDR